VANGVTELGALVVAGRIRPWLDPLGAPGCALGGGNDDDDNAELELSAVGSGVVPVETAPGSGS
jgi:hypothetical protein